jgi:hypothetical protein
MGWASRRMCSEKDELLKARVSRFLVLIYE